SAVAASLAVKSGLPTTALILPSYNNQHQDMQDALELIEMLNIEHYSISIQPAYEAFLASTQSFTNLQYNRQLVIKGNAQTRLRMMYLYAYA
ncbi:NAD(+) synthetase, partial [Francisella tularensis subsp. holarctica]|nr:NAD(+) synthetase [Francisella tularensis subsp. holarctica]